MDNKNKSIYDVFNDFLEKTIIKKKSYITDCKDNIIFKEDSIKGIIEAYINSPDLTKKSFSDKIKGQITVDIQKHIATNLLYLRDLPNDGISNKTKFERINPFDLIEIDEQKEGEKQEKWGTLFPSEHIASYRTDRSTHSDFVELIRLYEYLLNADTLKKINNTDDIKSKIIDWVLNKYKGNNVSSSPIDHMLLHLCEPENYSTTSSLNIKQRIVENLYKRYVVGEYKKEDLSIDKVDGLLKKLSYCDKLKDIANRNNLKHWSSVFWYSEIRAQWQGGYVANAYEILTKYQKQVILYGAPGTGKTYSAEQIIKEFICKVEGIKELEDDKLPGYKYKDNYDWTKEDSSDDLNNVELDSELKKKNVIWEMVQFNQSYSYEDFIEGLRPAKNNELKIVHGIFKRFAKVAAQKDNEGKKFIFIIDEINRGKIDKIFGELLYLLEYRDRELRLHYSNDEFTIPRNVFIVGTMNTADKSIALLDVALRRRFGFVRCEPNRDVLYEEFGIDIDKNVELKISNDDKPENIQKLAIKLFDWLNKQLDTLGNDADELKIGHSYFLKLIPENKDQEITFSDLKNIWFYSIVPLIEEYCGFDKARVEELLKGLSKKDDFELGKLASWKWN